MIYVLSFGWQVYKPTLSRFANAGGLVGESPAEVSKGNSWWSRLKDLKLIENFELIVFL